MRRSLLLVLAIPLLASCTSVVTGSPTAGTTLERRGPAGTVPAGLERFYGQQLGWEDCGPYATTGTTASQFRNRADLECARLEVPLDYAQPTGRTIRLGLLRQRAAGDRIGSLVVNPGGPGASGMSAAAGLASQVKRTDLGERFDLVGFDPRGVGASEPQVKCLSDAERDVERLDTDLDTSPSGIAQTEEENKRYAEKCASTSGVDLLANVGTRDVVRDLDVMRSALGDEKLTYLGYSYGTHIGAGYAQAFPGNVRALVLDGAVDPTQNQVESLIAQGAGFQKAFDAFAAWCAKRQDCALGADPAKANQAFRDLTLPLAERPVAVEDRELSYNDAITGAIQAMYSEELWEPLNTGLTELKNNQGNVLMLLADSYFDRDQQGRYGTLNDAFVAIKCVDEPRVTDRAVLDDVARRYKAAAPFLDDGRPAVGALDACAFWPVPPTVQEPKPVTGLPPVLVISTTGDPATPYDAGVSLAEELGGGLLTFEGNQHTVYLQGNECVDPVGDRYLIDLELPAEGTRCS
ncbi:alpha/beta hydrolase [Saccharothrix yanglingensis]|uniref:Alpha/beta hydrolase n=1 Tax=Saccharothrix yanglingensis TaxID=659496 RepID=A0ABU0XAV2_9PSEU|nr:alpha/beta hydrolase [Saccharothrix yanglingensis]MDQ2589235.1 alpha/beta hydrolase [Saccharothrix yanglingensis]